MAKQAGRETRLSQARSIIRNSPDLKKEEINARLIDKFGVGLRYSVILQEKRGIFRESPKLIPEKNLYTRYVRAIFGSQDGQRFDKLVKRDIWTKEEALSLSKLPLSRLGYLQDMEKSRENLINQMKIQKQENHWTKVEYTKHLYDAIQQEYLQRNWKTKKGEPEIFRMIDDFRQILIDDGKNPSPGGKRLIFKNPDGTFRTIPYKGDTAGQKARYRELYPDRIRQQKRDYRARVKARSR